MIRYGNGATGVLQASTAFWPGYPERIELHGTKGTAIITGDKLTTLGCAGRRGRARAASAKDVASGASDPMAISLEPFERQFRDFGEAIEPGASRWSAAKKATRRSSWSTRSTARAGAATGVAGSAAPVPGRS